MGFCLVPLADDDSDLLVILQAYACVDTHQTNTFHTSLCLLSVVPRKEDPGQAFVAGVVGGLPTVLSEEPPLPGAPTMDEEAPRCARTPDHDAVQLAGAPPPYIPGITGRDPVIVVVFDVAAAQEDADGVEWVVVEVLLVGKKEVVQMDIEPAASEEVVAYEVELVASLILAVYFPT